MKDQTREDPKILAAAERQMKAYSKSQEIADWLVHEAQPERFQRKLGPYITLSREAGAGGGKIAELIGHQLGWEVLDKQLVERIAERYHLSRTMLELVDETIQLGLRHSARCRPARDFPREYVVHLTRVLLASAARQGGARRPGGEYPLAARRHGRADRCLGKVSPRRNHAAARIRRGEGSWVFIAESDEGRREFVRRFFHHDITDPHLYDLVVNVDRIGPRAPSEVIAAAFQRWHPHAAEAA